MLLFYAGGPNQTFNIQRVPLSPSTLKRFGGKRQDFADEARTRKITTDEESLGGFCPDVWSQNLLPAASAERLGYPTQKPLALLETVIAASSNPGDLVLDPFCGCGTSIDAAHRLDRKWIGIDITHIAVGLIKHRLFHAFGIMENKDYRVVGEPEDIEGARQLAHDEPYQFQSWALGKVGARTANDVKRGADQGIDGRLYFHDEGAAGKTKQIIFSVKAGKTGPDHVRDLSGVVGREKAEIGVLITMQESTKPMRSEAASGGFYESPHWGKFPRIQMLSIEDLLSGKGIQYPRESQRIDKTFKRAPKAEEPTGVAAQRLDLAENDDE